MPYQFNYGQTELIKLAERRWISSEGLCFGVANMAMQAILCGELP